METGQVITPDCEVALKLHHGSTSASAILDALNLFISPGQVTELRALKVARSTYRPRTVAGFFDADHLGDMAGAAAELSPLAKGVYFIPNPLNPDVLGRACNRVVDAEEDQLAGDRDVIARKWMLIDADPVRTRGVSSTDAEKATALDCVGAIRDHLGSLGWSSPILADSGNGYHLLYRVDLPADDGGLVRDVLRSLVARFSTSEVQVDPSVFNPSRIVKLYGTEARKGDSIPTRPHRSSLILDGFTNAA